MLEDTIIYSRPEYIISLFEATYGAALTLPAAPALRIPRGHPDSRARSFPRGRLPGPHPNAGFDVGYIGAILFCNPPASRTEQVRALIRAIIGVRLGFYRDNGKRKWKLLFRVM